MIYLVTLLAHDLNMFQGSSKLCGLQQWPFDFD